MVFIAEHEKYFAREGLAVTLDMQPFGKDALETMLAGNAEFAIAASLPVSAVILNGAEPRLLATIARSEQSQVVVANGKHGITKPADLRGKIVAVKFGTTLQFYLDVMLTDAGVRSSEVRLLDLDTPQALGALRSGAIDATVQFSPLAGDSLESPTLAPTFFSPMLYTMHWNLISTGRDLKARPAIAEKLLRALIAAQEFALDNPDQAVTITARRTGMTAEDLAPYWPAYALQVQLPQSLVVTLEDETRWANSLRSASSPSMPTPNFLDYLDAGPLHQVKPDAVRVTR